MPTLHGMPPARYHLPPEQQPGWRRGSLTAPQALPPGVAPQLPAPGHPPGWPGGPMPIGPEIGARTDALVRAQVAQDARPAQVALPWLAGDDLGAAAAQTPNPVAEVISTLKRDGTEMGLTLARKYGPAMVAGAQTWIDARAWTEEELSREIARRRAARAKMSSPPPDLPLEFLEARVAEVRAARAKGATPPQAVIDKPEVASHGIPPWVTYASLGIAVVSLAYTFYRASKEK